MVYQKFIYFQAVLLASDHQNNPIEDKDLHYI